MTLRNTVQTNAEMKKALEMVVNAFRTKKFPSGHLAEFVNHVRAWTISDDSAERHALFLEDTVR